MSLLKRLLGKAGKEKRTDRHRMSPLLQAMAAELPRWQPEKRRILEQIIVEAEEAGVSSMEEMSKFLDAHPPLRAGFTKAMAGAVGPEWEKTVSPALQEPEPEVTFTLTNLRLGDVDISSAEELEAYYTMHPEEGIEWFTLILKDAQAGGDREAEGFALGNLGLAYARLKQIPKAIYYFEHHLEIARELGNWGWEMADCDNLGHAHLELGEIERARFLYEKALELAQQRADRAWVIKHSFSLAGVYARLGDAERAAKLANHATALRNQDLDRFPGVEPR